MKKSDCLIYCNCGAGIISAEKQNQLAHLIKQQNIDVFELHDLCAFSLNEKGFLNSLEESFDNKFIAACYPRAIKHMFLQNRIGLSNYKALNYRELTAEQIIEGITPAGDEKGDTNYVVMKTGLTVPAWYPVIDKSRCTLCGQCARFCVFGVYRFDKKNLEVVSPLSCKNNCPACGRTCPSYSIIFPRLPENSVLTGAEPGNGTNKNKNIAKEGFFVLLNERNNTRRNIFRQDEIQLAEDEKRKATEELKKGLIKK